MSHAKYAKDLIGHPHIGDEGTTFITGKVTEAVKASQDEVTVIALDEINRAPTSAKDELYSALDGRVKVSMDEAGGIEIEGDASNLIVISTMNKGSGHHVEPLDFAEKRRLGDTYPVDFLGVENPEKEIELIEENTPVSNSLASEIVRTANEIRATATAEGSGLSYGAPTGTLMVWAKKAFTNNLAGKSDPVVRAGRSSLANTIYDHNQDEVSEVNTIISKNMQGVDFFPDETEEDDNENSSTLSEKRYVCEDEGDNGCSWSAVESEADYVATEYLSCPECDGGVSEIKPGE
jgi:DNA-directed RNA polymerase subunit M/transcription elongation factor TFIIS